MTDNAEPKARFPRQEVNEGQEHGYLGDVEVYDPPQQEGGFSNVSSDAEAAPAAAPKGKVTHVTAEDMAPDQPAQAGESGTIKADDTAPKSSKGK